MNVQETLQILEALKSCGATHFKSQDFEIRMDKGQSAQSAPVSAPVPPTVDPAFNAAATDKIKDLISTLKMDDSQLIDKIFPAGAGF